MSDPVPQRIGDAERDRAVGYLQEHLAQGRLTQDEFDDRIGTALSARTADDLTPLFSDLPAPRPDGTTLEPTATSWPAYSPPPASTGQAPLPANQPAPASPPAPAGDGPPKALIIVSSIVWPAWLLVMFATSWDYWWLVFVPIMVTGAVGRAYGGGRDRHRDRYRHRRLGE